VQALTVLRQRGVPAPLFRLDSKFIRNPFKFDQKRIKILLEICVDFVGNLC
jgi:hypothetical protein